MTQEENTAVRLRSARQQRGMARSQRSFQATPPKSAAGKMRVSWRLMSHTLLALNVALMLAVLCVSVLVFTRPCPPHEPEEEVSVERFSLKTPRQENLDGTGLATLGEHCRPAPGRDTVTESLTCNTSDVITDLMRQAVKRKMRDFYEADKNNGEASNATKPFAHLVLAPAQDLENDDASLRWDVHHNLSSLQGIEYDQAGFLLIPAEGYYFIYSNLHYEETPGHDFLRERLKHSMRRTEEPYFKPYKLLFNEQTPCQVETPGGSLASSYVGGEVHLNRHARLSVTTTLPDTLHHRSHISYFGLYLI